MKVVAICLGLLACTPAAAWAQTMPARERAQATVAGTASISGLVTTDAQPPVPVRKARVTLSNPELAYSRTIVTDETGTFTFTGVSAGRFSLSVMKEAFVTMSYGARQPGRPGTSLVVADGAKVSGIIVRLPRGAVVTGVVTDWLGRPVPDVSVSAMQYGYVNGARRLAPQGNASTDDRGVYRVYGLRAGQYLLMASPGRLMFSLQNTPDLVQVSEADVERALQDLQRTAPGEPAPRTESGAFGRPVGHTPIYFPNVTAAGQATVITVAAGEERSGIDIPLSLIPSGRIDGTVSHPDGPLPSMVLVTVASAAPGASLGMDSVRTTRAGEDGKFQFGALPPGEYIVAARGNVPRPGGETQSALWAMDRVFVDGESHPTVALELRPGLTVSGRIQFDAEAPPKEVRGWRVALVGAGSDISLGVSPGDVQPDGRFSISGVTPGRYRVRPTPATGPGAEKWMARSVTLDGRDILEEPVQINGSVEGVVVTVTDRVSQIGGKLEDASGAPASDYHIIVFPADRARWIPETPRIQAVRPSTDGTYVVKKLPPGEYLLVALIDVEPGEWGDPDFLKRVSSAAMTFSLAEGEQKVQDLRLGGG